MTHTSNATPATAHESPDFRFQRHSFGAYCYDTRECRVAYNGREQLMASQEHGAPSFDPATDPQKWEGGELVAKTFPGPVDVSWTAADGTKLHVSVDLDAIFRERKILHRVDATDIPDNARVDDPAIIIVVVDRKIDVYMRAFVPTISEQIPGNRYSTARTDLILAWSHRY